MSVDPLNPGTPNLETDSDGASASNNTSIEYLPQDGNAWTGDQTFVEYLCFYDATTWPLGDRATKTPTGCGPIPDQVQTLSVTPTLSATGATGATVSWTGQPSGSTIRVCYRPGATPDQDPTTCANSADFGFFNTSGDIPLVKGKSYAISVFAQQGVDYSRYVDYIAFGSTQTITGAGTSAYGVHRTLSTTLTAIDHGPVMTAPVTLWRRALPSGSAWQKVTSVTTSTKGVAKASIAVTSPANYQWRYAGEAPVLATTSATALVGILPVVSATLTKAKIKKGKTAKVYGTVTPTSAGSKVYLQKHVGSKWTTVASTKIAKLTLPNHKRTYGYVFTLVGKTKGTLSYRVYKPAASGYVAAYSPTKTLKVRK